GMSALCQKRTHALQQRSSSFNHLRRRGLAATASKVRPSALAVLRLMTNSNFVDGSQQVGRLLTIEDAGAEFAIPCDKIRTVTHRPARFRLIAEWSCGAGGRA